MPLVTDDYGMSPRLQRPPKHISVDAYQGQTLLEPEDEE